MRNAFILIGCFIAGLCGSGCADSAFATDQTLTGTVVDLSCYVMDKGDGGMHHKTQGGATPPNVGLECAYSCVRWQGMPAGLLTSDGKTYQIAGALAANSNVKIAPHLTHTVTIKGKVSDLDGVLLLDAADVTMAK